MRPEKSSLMIVWWNPILDLWKAESNQEISTFNVLAQCVNILIDQQTKEQETAQTVPEVIEESDSEEEEELPVLPSPPQDPLSETRVFGVALDTIMQRPNEIGIPSTLKRLIQIITMSGTHSFPQNFVSIQSSFL